ncbi:hypothetical protein PanWU01x14_210810 [Parasponia andersonii]|uniref:Uncharacterized protein n=1 Tax=Parasponia andersonii TaxID=3476 RepID=A0A2P5BTW4_PARAD|nr:hypothetical protein PanWU01x14_210810 [Parasponia andersonii]
MNFIVEVNFDRRQLRNDRVELIDMLQLKHFLPSLNKTTSSSDVPCCLLMVSHIYLIGCSSSLLWFLPQQHYEQCSSLASIGLRLTPVDQGVLSRHSPSSRVSSLIEADEIFYYIDNH